MIEYRIWPEVTEEVMGTPICGDDTDGPGPARAGNMERLLQGDAIKGYLADHPSEQPLRLRDPDGREWRVVVECAGRRPIAFTVTPVPHNPMEIDR